MSKGLERLKNKNLPCSNCKELKALELIKEKRVDCFKLIAIMRTSDHLEHYNQNYGKRFQLTQEEYDSLKEELL